MIENNRFLDALAHLVMLAGIALVAFPLYMAWVASTHSMAELLQSPMPLTPGHEGWSNYQAVLAGGNGPSFARMLWVSLVTAVVIAVGKIAVSLLSAFALVYFQFPLRKTVFAAIFITLMLPVEVRIVPTYEVMAGLGLLDSYTGLTLPLMASATATFLLRQFFFTVPSELVEAARIDGAGPLRFFGDILLPLSKTSLAALFVIQFVYGWNQYLWPLLVSTQEAMYPVGVGLKRMISGGDSQLQWHLVMAAALLAMAVPAGVVVVMQKWFVKGLVESEK
jgi:sn-glycerol 3-phosphate transport system permease protein